MGQVFRVEDATSGQALALKVLRPLDADDIDRVRRFQREIQILTRIRHPAVLHILDWGDSAAGLYFVTELVDGEDLKVAIRRRGAWPAAEAAALGATLAEALAAAHAQGVVHRDVKPNNVMIARDGSVRLLDFGLARGAGIDLATLTRTILGTPGYMSPEQFDAHGVDERSDLCASRARPSWRRSCGGRGRVSRRARACSPAGTASFSTPERRRTGPSS